MQLYEKEEVVVKDKVEQQIKITHKSENIDAFWLALNRKTAEAVGELKINFEYDSHVTMVAIHIHEGKELQILKESKLFA
ncbi:uncharacterized protein NPIL_497471 [Nephila pilipes]|uniref:Uncharacterized protein n=1 Tax=Nephila pilipes TaxID=299642 RepID=A0A8X6QRL8_NEPPI|nr:uncharacterized protein NPIL_497471 [Nephila pilipes]